MPLEIFISTKRALILTKTKVKFNFIFQNNETMKSPITERDKKQKPKQPSAHLVYSTDRGRLDTIRKNSISLLDPEATAIPSLMDLTQQDYEVNAPVNNFLLNGVELLSALDTNTAPM